MRILTVFLICSALCACAKKPIPVSYQQIKIELPADPDMPIKRLSDNSDPADVMKSYVATVYNLRAWNQAVRRQVGGY